MANLQFITPQIATGGDLPYLAEAGELGEWVELGITHVVDNRGEWSDEDLVAELAPEIRYLHNGVDDAGQQQSDVWFDRGTEWIRDVVEDSQAKVHIHCHMGINRGPSLAYAALLDLGWDPIDAIDSIRKARPIAGLGYAEDALRWHHRREGSPDDVRDADLERLARWRAEHPIDVVRIIRSIRAGEEPQVA